MGSHHRPSAIRSYGFSVRFSQVTLLCITFRTSSATLALKCAQRAMRLLRLQSTFCVLACPTAASDTEYSVRLQSHWTLCCTTVPPCKFSGSALSHPGLTGVSFRAGLLTKVGDRVERGCFPRAFFRLCFSIKARASLLVRPRFLLLVVSCF